MILPTQIPPTLTPRLPRIMTQRAVMHFQNARVLLSVACQYRQQGRATEAARSFRAAHESAVLGRTMRGLLEREVGKRDAAVAMMLHRRGLLS